MLTKLVSASIPGPVFSDHGCNPASSVFDPQAVGFKLDDDVFCREPSPFEFFWVVSDTKMTEERQIWCEFQPASTSEFHFEIGYKMVSILKKKFPDLPLYRMNMSIANLFGSLETTGVHTIPTFFFNGDFVGNDHPISKGIVLMDPGFSNLKGFQLSGAYVEMAGLGEIGLFSAFRIKSLQRLLIQTVCPHRNPKFVLIEKKQSYTPTEIDGILNSIASDLVVLKDPLGTLGKEVLVCHKSELANRLPEFLDLCSSPVFIAEEFVSAKNSRGRELGNRYMSLTFSDETAQFGVWEAEGLEVQDADTKSAYVCNGMGGQSIDLLDEEGDGKHRIDLALQMGPDHHTLMQTLAKGDPKSLIGSLLKSPHRVLALLGLHLLETPGFKDAQWSRPGIPLNKIVPFSFIDPLLDALATTPYPDVAQQILHHVKNHFYHFAVSMAPILMLSFIPTVTVPEVEFSRVGDHFDQLLGYCADRGILNTPEIQEFFGKLDRFLEKIEQEWHYIEDPDAGHYLTAVNHIRKVLAANLISEDAS